MCTMDSEQFFLKWNNFENNLISGFADLLQKEAMVDVTLAAGGKIVQAHKIILSICSSYFRNMFQVNPCQHPIVVLKDVGYQELSDMLDFMYKGEANVKQEDLPSFLKLAETLKVKGLAGNQGEVDNNVNKKDIQPQISAQTKDVLSIEKEIVSNEEHINKDVTLRKRKKRPMSPLASGDSKILSDPENMKLEIKYNRNFLENNFENSKQNVIKQEERLSDSSLDLCVNNHVVHEALGEEKDAGRSLTDDSCETIPQVMWNPEEYSLKETSFGNFLLAVGGHSFRKRSSYSGNSYWACSKSKCPAKGILRIDGIYHVTNFRHNHRPDADHLQKKEKLLELRKLALKLNCSGRDLLKMLDINHDVKSHLSFVRNVRSRRRKSHNQNYFTQPSTTIMG